MLQDRWDIWCGFVWCHSQIGTLNRSYLKMYYSEKCLSMPTNMSIDIRIEHDKAHINITIERWRLTDCDFSTRSHLWIISRRSSIVIGSLIHSMSMTISFAYWKSMLSLEFFALCFDGIFAQLFNGYRKSMKWWLILKKRSMEKQ